MDTFADYQPALYPTALQDPYGQSWGRAHGTMKDRTVTLAVGAVDAGMVLRAPEDALPYLGADVALEQLPGESSASYRTRIAAAWSVWPWAGTRTALVTVFAQLYPTATTHLATASELSRAPWAQWWAFITPSTLTRRAWGAPATWGSGVWGSTATRTSVRTARRLARQFSNARDRGWIVSLLSSPGVWGAPATWGAPGVWGGRNPRWSV